MKCTPPPQCRWCKALRPGRSATRRVIPPRPPAAGNLHSGRQYHPARFPARSCRALSRVTISVRRLIRPNSPSSLTFIGTNYIPFGVLAQMVLALKMFRLEGVFLAPTRHYYYENAAHRHSGAGRNPGVGRWTPAFAGVTARRPYHFHPRMWSAGAWVIIMKIAAHRHSGAGRIQGRGGGLPLSRE